MVYTPMTRKAMALAYRAHHGQLDGCGAPYIYHPVHLAEQMEDEASCCAALLHDVIEDTAVTLEELQQEFPPEVTEAVDLLTHREDTAYDAYLQAIAAHPIARRVKLADIAHNSDQSRCVGTDIPREQLLRWQKKYQIALDILTK